MTWTVARGVCGCRSSVMRAALLLCACTLPLLLAASGCAAPGVRDLHQVPDSRSEGSRIDPLPDHDDADETGPVHRLSINGDTIEARDLWRGQRDALAEKAKTLTREGFQSFLERRAARLIRDRITETLLYQRAKLHLAPDAEQRVEGYVDAEIRRIIAADFGGRQRRYEKHLQAEGRTLQDAREELRRQIIVAGYLEREVKPKVVEPTRGELLAVFRETADSFRRPERRRMSLIEVRFLEPSDAGRAQAVSRMENALAQLRSGLPFEEVARRCSDGLHAPDGGAWGWVTRGSVRQRFEPVVEVLYGLGAGEVSEVVETDHSLFLIRCDEIDAGFEPDFQAVQPILKERHFRATYQRLVAELVTELRHRARIEPADLERFHAAVVEAALDEQLVGGS